MRRTAKENTEVNGCKIATDDKVIMWCLSANRDDAAIENSHDFIIYRALSRQHISFGFSIHRCVGNRLAELQRKIL